MIKFVYFDVGGVVIRDFSKTSNWRKLQYEIGLTPSQTADFDVFWDKYPDIDTIRDIETLIPLIEQEFKVKLPTSYSLLLDGFVSKFYKNKSIWPLVETIHKNNPVGLLTNMYVGMFNEIQKNGLLPDVKWDAVVDSSIVNFRKPQPEMFKLAEKMCGFKGSEILFVENSPGHIEAAKKLDWETFLYDPADVVKSNEELLATYLALLEQKS